MAAWLTQLSQTWRPPRGLTQSANHSQAQIKCGKVTDSSFVLLWSDSLICVHFLNLEFMKEKEIKVG